MMSTYEVPPLVVLSGKDVIFNPYFLNGSKDNRIPSVSMLLVNDNYDRIC